MSAHLIVVATFASRMEAELAQQDLEAEGIPSFVRTDDLGGMRPSLQFTEGVELLVREDDAPRARALLEGGSKAD